MKNNEYKRGEIATVLTIGAFVFLGVATVISSLVLKNTQTKQTLKSKAAEVSTCRSDPETPPAGYHWKVVKNLQGADICHDNNGCPQNSSLPGDWKAKSNWCYGFKGTLGTWDDWRCLMLMKDGDPRLSQQDNCPQGTGGQAPVPTQSTQPSLKTGDKCMYSEIKSSATKCYEGKCVGTPCSTNQNCQYPGYVREYNCATGNPVSGASSPSQGGGTVPTATPSPTPLVSKKCTSYVENITGIKIISGLPLPQLGKDENKCNAGKDGVFVCTQTPDGSMYGALATCRLGQTCKEQDGKDQCVDNVQGSVPVSESTGAELNVFNYKIKIKIENNNAGIDLSKIRYEIDIAGKKIGDVINQSAQTVKDKLRDLGITLPGQIPDLSSLSSSQCNITLTIPLPFGKEQKLTQQIPCALSRSSPETVIKDVTFDFSKITSSQSVDTSTPKPEGSGAGGANGTAIHECIRGTQQCTSDPQVYNECVQEGDVLVFRPMSIPAGNVCYNLPGESKIAYVTPSPVQSSIKTVKVNLMLNKQEIFSSPNYSPYITIGYNNVGKYVEKYYSYLTQNDIAKNYYSTGVQNIEVDWATKASDAKWVGYFCYYDQKLEGSCERTQAEQNKNDPQFMPNCQRKCFPSGPVDFPQNETDLISLVIWVH